MRHAVIAIAAGLTAAAGPLAAQAAPTKMRVPCQQNKATGKITADGSYIPEDALFDIELYEPAKVRDDTWTEGQCLIRVKPSRGR